MPVGMSWSKPVSRPETDAVRTPPGVLLWPGRAREMVLSEPDQGGPSVVLV